MGFVPDVDAATPGAITDCTNVIPFASGMRAAPSLISASGVPALGAECRGAAVVTKLDGSRRIFAGTATKLYELLSGAWTDVSRVGDYSLGADDRWDFEQFGDATLASNGATTIQRSNGTGDFADISGAPNAVCLEVAEGFVIAFGTDSSIDEWRCCAYLDETDWTVSLSTQANSGRLVSTPGAIVSAKALGGQVVVYKESSIYLGRYVGTPEVWQFVPVPGDVGCIGVSACADLGGVGHAILARSDIMLFDGSRPVSIAEGSVRQWFATNVSQAYAYKSVMLHDKQNGLLWLFYPSRNSSTLDEALVYHLARQQWGRCTVSIEAAMNYITAGVTINDMDTLSATIDGLPEIAYDSQYWVAGGRMVTVFNTSHQMSTLTGANATSAMTLFEVGSDQVVSRLSRLRVAYSQAPTTAAVSGRTKMARGDSAEVAGSGTYGSGKFDIRQSGRFHKLTVSATGNWAAAAVDFDFLQAGNR